MGKQIKLKLLQGGGLVTSLAPLITCIAINWNDYVIASGGKPWKLSIGGTIAVFLIALAVLGKLKMPGLKSFFAIILVIVFLIEPILADLKLLCACALGGQLLNGITFELFAKNYQETITMEKQAKITKNVFNSEENKKDSKYSGRV